MAKHILLDIDDTLFPSTEFADLARHNAINAMIGMGLDADYQAVRSRLDAIIARRGSNYQNHFDELCAELGLRKPARFIAAAVAAYHDTKTAIQPFPRVPATLMRLRELGHRIYIATNGNPVKQWDKLIRLRIALYFDDVFVSGEIGSEKGESFYRSVLAALHAKPGDCMMVGDREDADIIPARNAGMITVRMNAGKYAGSPTSADYSITDIGSLIGIVSRAKKASRKVRDR